MRARSVFVLSAALALGGVGVVPAHAAPAPPALSEVETPVPGRVTATVATDQPFVIAGLSADLAQGTAVPVTGGTAAVELETWLYGAGTTLHAVACETEVYAVETCSEPVGEVFDPVTFTLDPLPVLTQTVSPAAATIRTPLRGSYSASWTLTRTGEEPLHRGPVLGTVPEDGVVADVITLTDDDEAPDARLDSGTWALAVTLTVTDPEFGEDPLPASTVHSEIVVDRNGPSATLGAVRTVIHPRVDLPSHPGTVTVSASGDTADIAGWVVRKNGAPLGSVVRTYPDATTSITWDGRDQQGQVVAPSTYRIHTVDEHGNLSAATSTTSWAVGVTDKRIVTRTATRQVTAGRVLLVANVGRCSTLRRPSLRRTPGSLGLYSNTRCRAGARPSQVSTLYGLRLPSAALSFVSIRVYTFSGASTKRPRSRATIHYITNRGLARLPRRLGSTIKTYAGRLPPAPHAYVLNLNQSGTGPKVPYFMWNVAVGGGNRYDLRDFVVRVRYRVVV